MGARAALVFMMVLGAFNSVSARATCPLSGTIPFPDPHLEGPIGRGPGSTLIFTGALRVNTDGSLRSYHPMGQAAPGSVKPINSLCNAIAVRLADGTRLSAQTPPRSCSFITKYYVPTRDSGWAKQAGFTIDWYAIPQGRPVAGHYNPCIVQSGPFKGFFVSMTRLSAETGDECLPQHWVNSDRVPYITLPGTLMQIRGTLGSLALVHARLGGKDQTVVAVVADKGNDKELGEGSIALHRALRGLPIDETAPVHGYQIETGVTTVLFPGTTMTKPITNERLQARRAELLQRLGSAKVARACTGEVSKAGSSEFPDGKAGIQG